jgi:Pectate lyase superfamily protein
MTTPDPFASGYRLTDGNQLNLEIANPTWSTSETASATPGGTMLNSTKIVNTITNITSAVTAGSGVTLPQALTGRVLVLSNNSNNDVRVFAEGQSTINGLDGAIGIILAKGTTGIFTAVATQQWSQLNTTNVSPQLVLTSVASSLKSTPVSASSLVYVEGYYTAGDGGGGYFYAAPTAAPGTYVDNGGTVIVPSVGITDGSTAWLRIYSGLINILWFGAKGDGLTDNTTFIQNALNTGKSLFVPQGNFIVLSTLTMNTFGQGIVGTGYASKLNLNDVATGLNITGYLLPGGTEDTLLRDLHISSYTSTTTLVRYIAAPAMMSVENVYFEGGNVHILTTSDVNSKGTYGLHCSHCVFYGAATYGIWVNPASSSYSQAHFIDNCEFFGNHIHLWVSGSNGIFVNHSRFERKTIDATRGPAIHFDGGSNFIVRDCYLEDNNDITFIEIGYTVSGVVIDGNVFSLNNLAVSTNCVAIKVTQPGNTSISVTNNQINMWSDDANGPVANIIDFNNAAPIICTNNSLNASASPGVTTGIISSCNSSQADFSQNFYNNTFATKSTQRNQVSWAKAWVCYNGASGTVLDGLSIASVTKNATGDYTINFGITMSNTNFVVTATADAVNNGTLCCFPVVVSKTTTSVTIQMQPSGAGTGGFADATNLNVIVMGSVY